MAMIRILLAALIVLVAAAPLTAAEAVAEDLPPSPGDPDAHPGLHIYDPPAFTHWPAVVYRDETRNAAFRIPVVPERERDARRGIERGEGAYHNPFGWGAGDAGSIGWSEVEAIPFQLPDDPRAESVSGLIDLPREPGRYRALLRLGDAETGLPLVIVPMAGAWPHAELRNGFPVDAEGRPVVLIGERPDPAAARRWSLLREELPAAAGPVVAIGDPLTAPDGDAWAQLPASAQRLPSEESRRPHHAALVATAGLGPGECGTLVWSPGNGPLHAGTVSPEEERALVAIRIYWSATGRMPRLILLLPPLPVDEGLRGAAAERRDQLRRTAVFAGWRVLDAALVGDPEAATRIAEGVHSRYPTGPARERLARELGAAVGAD